MNMLLSYEAPHTERTNEFNEKENFELAALTETHVSLSCTNMLKTKGTAQNLRQKSMGERQGFLTFTTLFSGRELSPVFHLEVPHCVGYQ